VHHLLLCGEASMLSAVQSLLLPSVSGQSMSPLCLTSFFAISPCWCHLLTLPVMWMQMFSGVHKGNCPVCLKEFSRRQSVEDPVIRNLALAYRQLHDLTREQYDLGLLSQGTWNSPWSIVAITAQSCGVAADVHGFSTSPPTALPPARSRSKSRATAAVLV